MQICGLGKMRGGTEEHFFSRREAGSLVEAGSQQKPTHWVAAPSAPHSHDLKHTPYIISGEQLVGVVYALTTTKRQNRNALQVHTPMSKGKSPAENAAIGTSPDVCWRPAPQRSFRALVLPANNTSFGLIWPYLASGTVSPRGALHYAVNEQQCGFNGAGSLKGSAL